MSITDKVSLDTLIRVRKMPPEDARRLLQNYDLDESEWAQAEKIINPPVEGNPKWDNRLWSSVAWLLGSSAAQIAKDKGVSRQTIFDQVNRHLTKDEKALRLKSYQSLEGYSAYKVAFFENIESLRNMKPLEAAMWLLTNVDPDTDE